jgi:copper chaperone CopZ
VNIGTARITYDETRVKAKGLEEAVERAGYKVAE